MKDFIQSLDGLLVALAAFIGALFPVVKWLVDRKKSKNKGLQKIKFPNSSRISIIFFSAVFITIMGIRYFPEAESDRTHTTIAAFDALNAKQYNLALQKADAVINENSGSAVLDQEELVRNATPQPPTGKVSAEQREQIFAHGQLNDVAACYYIKAEALEKLKRLNEAISAYCQVTNLTYARVLDPGQDVFWSPNEGAQGKLRQLQPAQ
jgi:hypothetical protein